MPPRSHGVRCFLLATVLLLLATVTAPAADEPTADEAKLIAVLKSDAPGAEKAITCKKLAVQGSKAAVPALAPLLADEKLSSWSRIALEAIGGPEVEDVLIAALGQVQGRQLVGVVNSLGVLRSTKAVGPLTIKLKDADTEVAAAAAVALGNIGNPQAIETLRAALTSTQANVRSAVAEGCIVAAERLAAAGQEKEATAVFDAVLAVEVSKQRRLEALRGAALARRADGIPRLVQLLRSADKAEFLLGLTVARELRGDGIAAALTAEIANAPPQRAPLILQALQDRSDQVVTPAILLAAKSGAKPARLAAIGVLRRAGDANCVSVLLDAASDADVDIAQAARDALAELPDKGADAAIAARLVESTGKTLGLLVEVAGQRRIEATPALTKAADGSDPSVRGAALAALGATIRLEDVGVLMERAASPRHPEDAAAARQALRAACVRMADREVCAGKLTAALDSAPAAVKVAYLEVLGAMGGPTALGALGSAGKDKDPQLQDVASRMLGQWMTIDGAPVLIDLAKNAPDDKYKTRALRGGIRIARQFTMPDRQRAEICEQALAAASRPAEQKLVLEVLARYPSVDTLAVAVKASQIPALGDEAARTAATIAKKLTGQDVDGKQLLAQLQTPVKLEIVKAQYGAGGGQKDVTELLRRHARDMLLIALPSPSYNTSFDGDPLPGTQKQLQVQYRINGVEGNASFAENAVILLPPPK